LETILLRIFGLVVGWILLLHTGLIRKIIQWILQFFKKSDIEK
jgi:ABC-type sulfate transport system permease component